MLSVVVLGPLLAVGTYVVLGPLGQGANSSALRLILLADLVYFLLLGAMVISRLARMIAARRAKSAGSRLHLRLTGVFAGIALVPAVLVAVFAGLTVNIGLEGWFSDRVRSVVGTTLQAAEAYQGEHRRDLETDIDALAAYLESAKRQNFFVGDADLRQVLTQGQAQIQRGLREAYVIDGAGELKARGERSYLFNFENPTDDEISRASAGEKVLIEHEGEVRIGDAMCCGSGCSNWRGSWDQNESDHSRL